jgi:hypothetical protein
MLPKELVMTALVAVLSPVIGIGLFILLTD